MNIIRDIKEVIWNILQARGTMSPDPLWFSCNQLQDETPLHILEDFMQLLLDNDIVVSKALFDGEGKMKRKEYLIKGQYLGLHWKEVERMLINEHR